MSALGHQQTSRDGVTLAYVEGWHVIAEANRIFGYDAWDRRTRTNSCVWTGTKGGFYHAAYTAKVRVSVRAGDITIVREGWAQERARPFLPVKPMSWHSRQPKPMPQNGRLLPLAIPLA